MDQYLGTINWVAFPFAPTGWAVCDGSLMPIDQNEPLFSLLGTQYGGDGIEDFALPNLQSAVALGAGQSRVPGRPQVLQGQAGTITQAASGTPVAATLGLLPIIAIQGIFPSRY